MKTGFLIVNYNDAITTLALIHNIKNYRCIEHILVVDNGSTDDSYEMLRKLQNPHISVIRNEENKGYGAGINYGVNYLEECTDCTSVIVSNADIVIYSEENLEYFINHQPECYGVMAPVIKEHKGLNAGWRIPTAVQDSALNIVGIHRMLRPKMLFYKEEYMEASDVVEVEAVSGCFFMVQIAGLKEVGYFDEQSFLYYEENMIARKMQKAKRSTYIDTTVEVFHNHSMSIDKSMNRLGKYKALKKSQRYFHKFYNHSKKWELLLLYITEKISYVMLMVVYRIKVR